MWSIINEILISLEMRLGKKSLRWKMVNAVWLDLVIWLIIGYNGNLESENAGWHDETQEIPYRFECSKVWAWLDPPTLSSSDLQPVLLVLTSVKYSIILW